MASTYQWQMIQNVTRPASDGGRSEQLPVDFGRCRVWGIEWGDQQTFVLVYWRPETELLGGH
jgi:hypothetical protein